MLVVDDEPAIRSAIVRYFAGLGHLVDAAATGAEAHALLESRRYDALLLVTDHSDFDYATVFEHAQLIVDTRNAFAQRGLSGPHVERA